MDKPFYQYQIENDALRYTFVSEGPRPVTKLVVYAETDQPNLLLADVGADGLPDYLSVSNNGDLERIMATVAQTLLAFFRHYPNATVAFSGNTPARIRLYQAVLAREIRAASTDFIILGLRKGLLELLQPNHTYDGFVVFLPS